YAKLTNRTNTKLPAQQEGGYLELDIDPNLEALCKQQSKHMTLRNPILKDNEADVETQHDDFYHTTHAIGDEQWQRYVKPAAVRPEISEENASRAEFSSGLPSVSDGPIPAHQKPTESVRTPTDIIRGRRYREARENAQRRAMTERTAAVDDLQGDLLPTLPYKLQGGPPKALDIGDDISLDDDGRQQKERDSGSSTATTVTPLSRPQVDAMSSTTGVGHPSGPIHGWVPQSVHSHPQGQSQAAAAANQCEDEIFSGFRDQRELSSVSHAAPRRDTLRGPAQIQQSHIRPALRLGEESMAGFTADCVKRGILEGDHEASDIDIMSRRSALQVRDFFDQDSEARLEDLPLDSPLQYDYVERVLGLCGLSTRITGPRSGTYHHSSRPLSNMAPVFASADSDTSSWTTNPYTQAQPPGEIDSGYDVTFNPSFVYAGYASPYDFCNDYVGSASGEAPTSVSPWDSPQYSLPSFGYEYTRFNAVADEDEHDVPAEE
ncbi:MAG: hypothetical protein Q9224_006695, partial [Gallowayella concinna]